MTIDEWKEVVQLMNVMYDDGGRLMFEKTDKAKLLGWYSCLSDLEYEGVAKAVRNLVMKSPYKPKVYDIRNEYMNLISETMLTEHEAWTMVRDGIRNGTYGASEEFAKLPPLVQDAVVSPSSLYEWAQLSSEEVDTVIQSLFKRQFRSVVERSTTDKVLGAIGTKNGELASLQANMNKLLEDKTK